MRLAALPVLLLPLRGLVLLLLLLLDGLDVRLGALVLQARQDLPRQLRLGNGLGCTVKDRVSLGNLLEEGHELVQELRLDEAAGDRTLVAVVDRHQLARSTC